MRPGTLAASDAVETNAQPPITVLYVEDDPRLGRLTTTYLEHHGLIVELATNGEVALESLRETLPDLVLLDVLLPGRDGHEVCRLIRERHDVPIIMVTALDEEADRVLGLEGGADDYVTKPFSSRELLARIRAQVRRARGKLATEPRRIEVGELVIDEQTRTVTLAGEELAMTSHEFTLLQALAERPGRVLSREQLINLTRERGDEIFERAVDVQISRLRQKLGDDPKAPEWIQTVRGVGYVLAARGS